MPNQNFSNHIRIVPFWHIVTSLSIVGGLIGSFVNLSDSWNNHDNLYSASLISLVFIIIGIYFVYIRQFPLRSQDRVIRAEENLRHFILTGKLLDTRLQMQQILALRFAPDDEFIPLAKKAVDENLSAKEIKKSVKNWKGDYQRM